MKIRLAEILDAMRFTERVVLKNTDGEILMDDAMRRVKLSKYRPWWTVRVDDDSITVAEDETDCEYISHDICKIPTLLDATVDPENPKYILNIGVTEDDLTDKELVLLHYGVLPETNYQRVLQLSVRDMAALIELFAGHSCGCDYCLVNDRCEHYIEYDSHEPQYDEFALSENCNGFYKWLQEPYSPEMFDKAREQMIERGPFPDGQHFPKEWYENRVVGKE